MILLLLAFMVGTASGGLDGCVGPPFVKIEGTYLEKTGLCRRIACPTGKYNAFYHRLPACDTVPTCGDGTFSVGWDATKSTWSCTPCARNFYQTKSAHDAAIGARLASNASLVGGVGSCAACPAGKSTGGGSGQSACSGVSSCPSGTYGLADHTCVACAPGQYTDVEDKTACKGVVCPAGKYGPTGQRALAMATCNPFTCAAGEAASTAPGLSAKTCTACAGVNPYVLTASPNTCATQVCANGKYWDDLYNALVYLPASLSLKFANAAAAAANCKDCGAGKYTDKASTACTLCAAGQYSSYTGTVRCKTCPAGKSASVGQKSLSSCRSCLYGQFAAEAGDECTNCARGQYNDQSEQTKCTKVCDPFFFRVLICLVVSRLIDRFKGPLSGIKLSHTHTHTHLRTPHPPHFISLKDVTCSLGYGQPTTFSGAQTYMYGCALCRAGTYSDDTSFACKDHTCSVGTASDSIGRPTRQGCNNCGPGRTSVGGASQCKPCAAGTYNDVEAAACKVSVCVAGSGVNALTGSVANAETCTTCAKGQYSAGSAAAGRCKACGAGTYQEMEGQASCKDVYCDTGQELSSVTGLVAPTGGCSTCRIGRSRPLGTATNAADPKMYQTGQGAGQCTIDLTSKCPAGQQPKTTFLLQNRASFLSILEGSGASLLPVFWSGATCDPCPAGKFDNTALAASCATCPLGMYTDVTGQTVCKPHEECDVRGTYKVVNSAASTTKTDCKSCESGKYNGYFHQDRCNGVPTCGGVRLLKIDSILK